MRSSILRPGAWDPHMLAASILANLRGGLSFSQKQLSLYLVFGWVQGVLWVVKEYGITSKSRTVFPDSIFCKYWAFRRPRKDLGRPSSVKYRGSNVAMQGYKRQYGFAWLALLGEIQSLCCVEAPSQTFQPKNQKARAWNVDLPWREAGGE